MTNPLDRIVFTSRISNFLDMDTLASFAEFNSTTRETVNDYAKDRITTEILIEAINNNVKTIEFMLKHKGEIDVNSFIDSISYTLFTNGNLLSLLFQYGLRMDSVVVDDNSEDRTTNLLFLGKNLFEEKLVSYDFVKALLDNGFDPNTVIIEYGEDDHNYSLIYFVDDEKAAELLIERGALINDSQIGTMGLRNIHAIKATVRAGVSLDIKVMDRDEYTGDALTLSIKNFGNKKDVDLFIKELVEVHGADVNSTVNRHWIDLSIVRPNDKDYPLTAAISNKYFPIAEYLLEQGANLHYYAQYDKEIIDFLYKHNFDFSTMSVYNEFNYKMINYMNSLGIDMRFYLYKNVWLRGTIKKIKTYDELINSGFTVPQMQYIFEFRNILSDKWYANDFIINKQQAEHLIDIGFKISPRLPEVFIWIFIERGLDDMHSITYYAGQYSRELLVALIKNGLNINYVNQRSPNSDLIEAAREYYRLISNE